MPQLCVRHSFPAKKFSLTEPHFRFSYERVSITVVYQRMVIIASATIELFLQDCRDEAQGLKNALSSANSRLAQLDALEADVRARTKDLKELQEERRECDENLATERGRTQHLVRDEAWWGVRLPLHARNQ